jgi:hypothetical protein
MQYDTSELFKLWAEDKLRLVHDPETFEGSMMFADSGEIIPNTEKPWVVSKEFNDIMSQLVDANRQRYRSRYDHR